MSADECRKVGLTIQVSTVVVGGGGGGKPLCITHTPPMSADECRNVGLTIQVSTVEGGGKPLCITHTPPVSADECRKVGLTIQVSTVGVWGVNLCVSHIPHPCLRMSVGRLVLLYRSVQWGEGGKSLCITHTSPVSADECRKVGLTIQVSTVGWVGRVVNLCVSHIPHPC